MYNGHPISSAAHAAGQQISFKTRYGKAQQKYFTEIMYNAKSIAKELGYGSGQKPRIKLFSDQYMNLLIDAKYAVDGKHIETVHVIFPVVVLWCSLLNLNMSCSFCRLFPYFI